MVISAHCTISIRDKKWWRGSGHMSLGTQLAHSRGSGNCADIFNWHFKEGRKWWRDCTCSLASLTLLAAKVFFLLKWHSCVGWEEYAITIPRSTAGNGSYSIKDMMFLQEREDRLACFTTQEANKQSKHIPIKLVRSGQFCCHLFIIQKTSYSRKESMSAFLTLPYLEDSLFSQWSYDCLVALAADV